MFKENAKMQVGGIAECHMTSWQGKSVDLAVSVRVVMKQ